MFGHLPPFGVGAKLSLVLYGLLTFNTPPAEEQLQDPWRSVYIP